MPGARPIVFVWENIGPTHIDRLEATARALPADMPVTAVQFSARSNTYEWRVGALPIDVVTLRAEPSTGRGLDLVGPLLRACWRAGRKADIFLCHYNEVPVAIAALLLRLGGRRVFTMIDSKFDDYPRRLLVDLPKLLLLGCYNGAMVAGRRSREYAAYLGVRRDRIATGYDTLSVDRIAALADTPPAPDGLAFAERDFVVVARLVPKKNLGMALEAFALWLARTRHPRRLHLLGAGPLEPELRARAERLGVLGCVVFHGFVQIDAVSRQLGRALCLLLTSTEEQFGLVVIEAQAVGLPVLCSANAGACDELVESGINGYIIDPENPRALAALMLQMSEDEVVWRRFATAARDRRHRGDARRFADAVLLLTGRSALPGDRSAAPAMDGERPLP